MNLRALVVAGFFFAFYPFRRCRCDWKFDELQFSVFHSNDKLGCVRESELKFFVHFNVTRVLCLYSHPQRIANVLKYGQIVPTYFTYVNVLLARLMEKRFCTSGWEKFVWILWKQSSNFYVSSVGKNLPEFNHCEKLVVFWRLIKTSKFAFSFAAFLLFNFLISLKAGWAENTLNLILRYCERILAKIFPTLVEILHFRRRISQCRIYYKGLLLPGSRI